jgi:hypothetical protein
MAHTGNQHSTDPHGSGNVGHETRDVAFRPIIAAGIGLLVLLVGSVVLMRLVFGYFATREARLSPPANPLAKSFARQVPPEPRLQPDPLKDLLDMHAEEDAVLNSYGWVDRKSGIVRIPINRAMELLAQRGLPSRPASGGTAKE